MVLALVVDDSKVDQRRVGALLEHRTDLAVAYADDGAQALACMSRLRPDVVLTDMQMPGMDGLALTEAVRRRYPDVPVVLITAHGSEDTAAQALRRGAAGYVPKKYLSRDLVLTLERVLALAGRQREQQRALECLVSSKLAFSLDNDLSRIASLVRCTRQEMERLHLCDQTALMRVGVALDEAVRNAIVHGNLQVDPALRDLGHDDYNRLLNQRRHELPYANRRVKVHLKLSHQQAVLTVRDQGTGFDLSRLSRLDDPIYFDSSAGRGLMLMHNFMDEVRFNQTGNQVTMVKYREQQFR